MSNKRTFSGGYKAATIHLANKRGSYKNAALELGIAMFISMALGPYYIIHSLFQYYKK